MKHKKIIGLSDSRHIHHIRSDVFLCCFRFCTHIGRPLSQAAVPVLERYGPAAEHDGVNLGLGES